MSKLNARWLAYAVLFSACAVGTTSADEPRNASVQELFEQALLDFDEAQHIQQDRPEHARRLFQSAAQRFAGVIATGVRNGRLEYNLGNCYLQMGDIGRALVHYRRAERITPRDPLLIDNIKEAQSRCLTPIPATRRSALLRSIFFWHYQTSFDSRCKFAVVTYAAFWLLLALRSVVRRRSVSTGAVCAGVLCMAVAGSLAYDQWSLRSAAPGVVTGMDVVAYKGPGTGYQRRFEQPLQPGVEFVLKERRGDWWDIELPDGNEGWIRKEAASLVQDDHERPG